jgi:hypothetical protein
MSICNFNFFPGVIPGPLLTGEGKREGGKREGRKRGKNGKEKGRR